MATPFSRTTRSLDTDNYYISLIGLGIAILLAIVWGNWFFTATITSYEVSQKVYVTDKEDFVSQFPKKGRGVRVQLVRRRQILAEFPQKAIENIHPGQLAYVRLKGKIGKQAGPIPATVTNVKGAIGLEKGKVELRADINADAQNPFKKGEALNVKIEVEHVTPATLVLRASGLLTDAPSLSVSPQQR
ncbi:hypothetical protein [Candidatus Parabeggiatoa sp. HSG14]|uniref:hypothetical protein n=1 Tax=Candidatus Parabeggiatoa sp. HSG14 TaxID=3055593 RepID=UPI0025A6E29A|nr:hypothetical protein [Thiotrichales bacterium HSG14]